MNIHLYGHLLDLDYVTQPVSFLHLPRVLYLALELQSGQPRPLGNRLHETSVWEIADMSSLRTGVMHTMRELFAADQAWHKVYTQLVHRNEAEGEVFQSRQVAET
jgi:hypothetical protein